jgi:hypothetical protein
LGKKNSKTIQKHNKLEQIAEILGLIEEKGKTKDWILEQLKKNHIVLDVSPTVNSFEILNSCSESSVYKIYKILKKDEEFQIEDIKILTKTMHWFFTDIIESSDPKIPVKIQARKINLLNLIIRKTETFRNRDQNSTHIQSTGDGVAIGFTDNPEKPLRLAIEVHNMLQKYNKSQSEKDRLHIRIGIDSGPVYFMKDIENKDTVWGPGIIMARRIMDLCGDDQIFTSRRIGDDISKLSPEYKAIMHTIGDYSIKHGQQLLIYNIYGKNFGNAIAPRKSKIIEKSITEDTLQIQPKFEFNNIEIRLEITDIKTMMTHHTWIWDVKNITKEPLNQIFYAIGGDIAKDFGDLNISIKNEEGKDLDIISLDVNRGHEKQFNAKLEKSIRKNQQGRTLTLEYDWEEPYQVFEYFFSAKCKKFKYVFTAPKELQIKSRILEVAKELGIKKRADPAPKITYLKDKIKITWETDKKRVIGKHETFEFQW